MAHPNFDQENATEAARDVYNEDRPRAMRGIKADIEAPKPLKRVLQTQERLLQQLANELNELQSLLEPLRAPQNEVAPEKDKRVPTGDSAIVMGIERHNDLISEYIVKVANLRSSLEI